MDDTRWMARALALAARGRGLTSPNPMVGALVVQDGADEHRHPRIIAYFWALEEETDEEERH